MCWLLHTTESLYQENLKMGKDPFTARNDSQVFHARTLSLAYIEVGSACLILETFDKFSPLAFLSAVVLEESKRRSRS